MSTKRKKSRSKNAGAHRLHVTLCSILAMLIVVLSALLICMYALSGSQYKDIHEKISVEAGSKDVSADAFLKNPDGSEIVFVDGLSEEELAVPGDHPVSVKWKNKVYDCFVEVVDTVAPTGKSRDVVSTGVIPHPSAFATDIADATDVTVTYKETPSLTTAGDQKVTVILTDAGGNTTELTATLTVVFDTAAPEIHGVRPMVIYLGDAVSYRAGITIHDDNDSMPMLSVDSSQVNLNQVGIYPVVYTAVDRAGNETKIQTTIEVRERKEGYVSVETIYAAVDEVLDQIIYDGFTTRQKVRAIYAWAKANCTYSDSSDKSDYMQEAYRMLTQLKGDCFSFFSISKLMFDRLGIPNIDVRKVKNFPLDRDHYWSMVSIDGGETWYHFDCTPINGADDMCLVTDAVLEEYSKNNDDFYNRDESLYPATPEK